jgi:D-alanine-D-alanine ligase
MGLAHYKDLQQPVSAVAPIRRRTRVDELQKQIEKMQRRLRSAVIFAGSKEQAGAVINATTNARSWKSYEAVAHDIARSLQRLGCRDVEVIPEDMRLAEQLQAGKIHFAWLNSGGVQGYSSVAHGPSMLEMLGIPYVGHDPLLAATLDNKHAFKRHLKAVGIPTAPFVTWHPLQGRFDPRRDRHFKESFSGWHGDFVVKPVSGRASLNVHYVSSVEALPDVVQAVYETTANQVLIEGYLSGKEYCAAVCGPIVARGRKLERLDKPFVFACVERRLDPGEKIFTSMDIRPITADRVRPLDPAHEADMIARLETLARDVYVEMSLETLVRLDVRADEQGRLYVLEANPKPDLKAPANGVTSIICAGLDQYGMDYDDLIYSLFADRIDLLFSRKRGSAERLLTLAGL